MRSTTASGSIQRSDTGALPSSNRNTPGGWSIWRPKLCPLAGVHSKASGLYWRGVRNTGQIQVKRNRLRQTSIPEAFRAFTILQLSDLHCDTCPLAMQRLTQILRELKYDLCVLTGDYRGQTYGPYDATLAVLARIRAELSGSVYGVLGNHDTVRMVPAMEEMGIRMLLNESVAIERSAARIHLAGIDDAHFYAV